MGPAVNDYPRLVGDIGGTHARFASVGSAGAELSDPSVHTCAEFRGLAELMEHRLARCGAARPAACALGIATPLTSDVVRMTNLDWSFSIEGLQRRLGLHRLVVLNDFAALALGLPALAPTGLMQVGDVDGDHRATGAKVALGPGTGLGVAGLVHAAGRWRPVAGEGGHVSLAAETELEDKVLGILRDRFGHVSAERVLSGPGLVNLHAAVRATRGLPPETMDSDAPEITRRALEDHDTSCLDTLDCFFAWLGSFAGDMALAFGAVGGVYIGGGIVARMPAAFAGSAFRARFEAKGRYRSYLAAIPTWLVSDAADTALRGANLALDLDP